MAELLAYRSGEWIPAHQLTIPVTDAGFVQGVTIAEQLRTFNGQLFRVAEHMQRLAHSLEIVGFNSPVPLEELAQVARRLAAENHPWLEPGDDLGLSLFVTPGPYSTFAPEGGEPLVGMHTYPLPFGLWADKYESGQAVVITSVTQVPASCWSPALKCRSRMHYYLADREAARQRPGARALLLDTDGYISEASTANVVLYHRHEGLVSPPHDAILPGVSVATLRQLAHQLEVPWSERAIAVQDVYAADELFLTSTSPCLLPVTSCDIRPIGTGQPGMMYRRLQEAWNELVRLDIAAQAQRFARRERRSSP